MSMKSGFSSRNFLRSVVGSGSLRPPLLGGGKSLEKSSVSLGAKYEIHEAYEGHAIHERRIHEIHETGGGKCVVNEIYEI